MFRKVLTLVLLLSLVSTNAFYNFSYSDVYADVLSPGNISTCGDISTSGTYTLTQDISISGTCFVLTAPNVVIRGDGFTITGNGTGTAIDATSQYGIEIYDISLLNFSVGVDTSGAQPPDASSGAGGSTPGASGDDGASGDAGEVGGNISIYNSTLGDIIASGGVSGYGGNGGMGADGDTMNSGQSGGAGGSAGAGGSGSGGGNVIIRNSTVGNVTSTGGPGGTGGAGGAGGVGTNACSQCIGGPGGTGGTGGNGGTGGAGGFVSIWNSTVNGSVNVAGGPGGSGGIGGAGGAGGAGGESSDFNPRSGGAGGIGGNGGNGGAGGNGGTFEYANISSSGFSLLGGVGGNPGPAGSAGTAGNGGYDLSSSSNGEPGDSGSPGNDGVAGTAGAGGTSDDLAPEIVINAPLSSVTISTWSPDVSWSNSSSCYYSYDGSSFTTVNCASAGSDIPAPASGAVTLYARGYNGTGTTTASTTFSYINNVSSGGFGSVTNYNPTTNTYTTTRGGETYISTPPLTTPEVPVATTTATTTPPITTSTSTEGCLFGYAYNVNDGSSCSGNSAASTDMSSTTTATEFERDLYFGLVGEDVKHLQKTLNELGYTVSTSSYGSAGSETTFFGPKTKAALIIFQKAMDITPAIGYFGELSRGVLVKLNLWP